MSWPRITLRSPNVGTSFVARSVEYAHMYSDETVGTEQLIGAMHAADLQLAHNSHPPAFGQVPDEIGVLLIDDYNTPQPVWQHQATSVADRLQKAGRRPDYVFGEASFVPAALSLLDVLPEGRLRKNLTRYLEKHKAPCSLLTAAWYLTRLGIYESPRDILLNSQMPGAYELINVLPEIYRGTEDQVHEIIYASPWPWANYRISYEWIQTVKPWEHMKAASYFEDNYETPHPADLHLASLLRRDWQEIGRWSDVSRTLIHAVEIGAGPNLIPVLAALPYVGDLQVTDVSAANRTWLQRALQDIDPVWMRFRSTDRHIDELQMRANVVASVQDLSVYEMPRNAYDVASMHFVAESITNSAIEFSKALHSVHDSLKPGGHLLASFMLGSEGWSVAGSHFPAVPLTEDDVLDALTDAGFDRLDPASLHEGEEPVRDGYNGMLYVSARRA